MMHINKCCQRFHNGVVLTIKKLIRIIIDVVLIYVNPNLIL